MGNSNSRTSRATTIHSSMSRKHDRRKHKVSMVQIMLCIFISLLLMTIIVMGLMLRGMYNEKKEKLVQHGHHHHQRQQQRPHPGAAALVAGVKKEDDDTMNDDSSHDEPLPNVGRSNSATSVLALKSELDSIEKLFHLRYGGETMASSLFSQSILPYGSISATADRILVAAATGSPFVMAFAGSAGTVGIGNYHNQSYPFVVHRVLKKAMETILSSSENFVVRNVAMDGVPSFPYGLCLKHFLGINPSPDVIGWDFSATDTNRHGAGSIFEAYIRQSLSQLQKSPMFIMLDSVNFLQKEDDPNAKKKKNHRGVLLQNYTNDLQLIKDAIAVVKRPAENHIIITKEIFQQANQTQQQQQQQNNNNKDFFVGLSDFNTFGAPPTCPGQSVWMGGMKEHEYLGWMIAIHFVKVLRLVADKMEKQNYQSQIKQQLLQQKLFQPIKTFPRNVLQLAAGDQNAMHIMKNQYKYLLYGHKQNDKKEEYIMTDIECHTTYLPHTNAYNIDASSSSVSSTEVVGASSIVVGGFSSSSNNNNNNNKKNNNNDNNNSIDALMTDIINKERTDEQYEKGWVLDLSPKEREYRQKIENCDPIQHHRLGYKDLKLALYGIPESGTLKLWLPHPKLKVKAGFIASAYKGKGFGQKYFSDVLICESNDVQKSNKKRNKDVDSCQLAESIQYIVGGSEVITTHYDMADGVGEFKKRKLCINLAVPQSSHLSRYGDVINNNGDGNGKGDTNKAAEEQQQRKLSSSKNNNSEKTTHPDLDDMGLLVEITVKEESYVTREDGPCCISHVIWERRML